MIELPEPYVLRRMRVDDVPQVMDIEKEVFPTPWPDFAYRDEITRNPLSHCYVLLCQDELVGYGCYWLLVDEAHISTLAVALDNRRRGYGEAILLSMIHRALEKHAKIITLEVRESNIAAQAMYRKYGFRIVGRRQRYYADNKEDALIMTVEARSTMFQSLIQDHGRSLAVRLSIPPISQRQE